MKKESSGHWLLIGEYPQCVCVWGSNGKHGRNVLCFVSFPSLATLNTPNVLSEMCNYLGWSWKIRSEIFSS